MRADDGVIFAYGLPAAMPNLPSTAPLTTTFPGLNMVRIFYNNPSDMSFATLQTYINALTAAGMSSSSRITRQTSASCRVRLSPTRSI
jgi:hypothetical protein